MAIIPAPNVAAPEPLRRRYGIFDAVPGPFDLPPHGEGGGIQYVPDTCGSARVLGVNCYDPGDSPTKPFDTDNDLVETGVFNVMATLTCTLVGYTPEQLRAKVLRRLDSSSQAAVERALWSGLDFEGNTLGIKHLLGTGGEAADIGGSYDPGLITDVVAALERYAYFTQDYGYAAYIHAPIEVAALAAEAGLVHEERLTGTQSQRKVTPLGSVWSFGAYPAGQIVVTGQTNVWRGAERVVQSFERTDNQALLLAEQAYAVSFDCFAGVAEFDPLEVTSP